MNAKSQNLPQRQNYRPPAKSSDDRRAELASVKDSLERLAPSLAAALPRHLTPERMVRVAMSAVQNNPKLLDCDRNSFYRAILTAAQLGLEPDGVLGQAYLVPFKGKVQFIPGYKGLLVLARQSGEIASIAAREVCERDEFEYSYGLHERCHHVPATGDRGEITYFYAIAHFKDGGHQFEVLPRAQVEAVRNSSSGYRTAMQYAKNGQVESPWTTHFAEMGRKTAIRRIAKYLPMSVQRAAALADQHDLGRHASLDDLGNVAVDLLPDDAPQIEHQAAASKLDAFEDGGEPAGDWSEGDGGEPPPASAAPVEQGSAA